MDSSFYHVLAFVIPCLVLFLSRKSRAKRRLSLPPGPPGWPLVGNLFQPFSSGKSFFEYIDHLCGRYGPIFTLRMGARTLIIVSDAKLCHEAFIEKSALFASRPRENPTRNIFSCNKFTVNSAVYGPVWRSLRRNMVQNMLSSSKLKEFRTLRKHAMDRLIDRLKAEADANDGVVSVLKNARFAVFCILLAMCFGVEMDEETVVKTDEVMKSILITLLPRIHDFLPILSPFFYKQRRRALQVRKEQIEHMVPLIENRRAALLNPGSDRSAMPFSYLDTLFDLKVEGRKSPPSNSELVTLCSEFLNAGTDTTATAIEWGVAQLIENPEIQTKLFDEIQSTVGDRKVEEADLEKLTYLQAFVKELLRKHPPTYFSLAHAAIEEEAKLGGYDIPTDANLETFIPRISDDPRIWNEPDKFDPDRFYLGREEADITGVKAVKMIPFGVGRRICPALGMAMVHVPLMFAKMVQEFEWSAYPVNTKVDFSGKFEFTIVMKNTLKATIKPRVSG
ncbi:Cytochrome P450 77A2 [Hibiscus syriacus]|uniref:Cytochrome P450 77A2 n=1 Tax=Hibiscus syriacus TaxID=106335 RepID=A0A6A2YV09_HIBSY|nr:cytochrome P450 77A4-like [Hibiscus syriacus]KAE8683213.1 Cytochrome P450 77A2 [Hibiscus syriacus]